MTPELQNNLTNLKKRSLVIQAIRDFFVQQCYLEVDTPLRSPCIIPEAQIDPVSSEEYYLQASPELYMKRLLSKGFDKIFQICKCFRKNERGSFHLPELTLLEWYAKNQTYLDLMDDCENLIQFIAQTLNNADTLEYQGNTIHIESPWTRITVEKAFEQYASKSLADALKDNSFDEIISFEIEPHLGHRTPVFLYDYPASMASLAKLKPDNSKVAQRFELYINGIELANAYTELTDPIEQKKRFIHENTLRNAHGKSSLPMPNNFLSDLENLHNAAGIALGVDRLAMIFSNSATIDDVITFAPEVM